MKTDFFFEPVLSDWTLLEGHPDASYVLDKYNARI